MIAVDRVYICIDLKSFYASVECVARGLDPLKAKLLVADETRSDQTICLAVSPALKAIGVSSRPRLFEAKQQIRKYEFLNKTKVSYIIAPPRMAAYERVSAKVYSVYLKYVSTEDIHVYSIDECFIDATGYMHLYRKDAAALGLHPARLMATTMIRDVLRTTGITATVGIGENLYLAKVSMDILAKKAPPDENGVRIAELTEEAYRVLLWNHRPLTDFWQIGPGRARTLNKSHMFTMGDIAARSTFDEEYFYKTFGIIGELIIDHAWGMESATMQDIKSYRTESHSMSNGQVLARPYKYDEARNAFLEMAEVLCTDMFSNDVVTKACSWWVVYDYKSLEYCPGYEGPLSLDFYNRLFPQPNYGTVKLPIATNSIELISAALVKQFDEKTDHRLLYRRIGVCAMDITEDTGVYQISMFVDYEALERENKLRTAMHAVRQRFGPNSVFRGMNLVEGATTLERNRLIGGHKA